MICRRECILSFIFVSVCLLRWVHILDVMIFKHEYRRHDGEMSTVFAQYSNKTTTLSHMDYHEDFNCLLKTLIAHTKL